EKNQDIEVERTALDLEFSNYEISQALIFEPLISDQPLQDYQNPQRITVNVPDYPLIVELQLNLS
ncbi:MAG: hypothetical protein SWJ54_21845, partial [Cyanobacteriota bacterium]|nr:hypothetical protein [Cyanobacteriota bacterium]